ncbi:hypothetical protein DRJ17_01715 [Candidatus Woesearchaeota archaeon]|nr:MAG: hypothetical protein DRJ17_01715 [Candidatus Woesearchaeota archaeon]
MIKAILFDLGGVVLWPPNFDVIRKEMSKILGLPVFVIKPVVKKYWDSWKKGEINEMQFLQGILSDLNLSKGYIPNLKRIYRDIVIVRKSVLKIICDLRKNYKVGVLSNHSKEWIEFIEKKYKLSKNFDDFYISYMARSAKPDCKYYYSVLKRMKVKAKECVLIDDKLENLTVARKIGMKGVHYRNAEQMKKTLKKQGVVI